MKKENRIALVIPWYGSYPWYWKFFVHSMRYNPSIDCIIITDEKQTEDLPSNIKIVNKYLKELKDLIEIKLGFTVSLDYAYKLCDFKPAYGLIFEELLQEYNFWGHADIDLIFGNIRNFITDQVMDNYDLISVRKDYLTGFFLLFRNTEYMNQLFSKSKDYKKVFQSSQCWCFDECNYMHNEIQYNKQNILDVKSDIESMEHIVRKEIMDKRIRVLFDLMVLEGISGNIKWNNGTLLYKDKYEILLYHFIAFKSIRNLYIPKWQKIPNIFLFSKSTITSLPRKKIERLKLKFNLRKDKLIELLTYFFRVNILGGYFSSALIKKTKFDIIEFLGYYTLNNSSILYTLYLDENQLFFETKDVRIPLYHLWVNTFITSDFKTILIARRNTDGLIFTLNRVGLKRDLLIKMNVIHPTKADSTNI